MERRECSASGIRLILKGLFGGPDRDRTDDLFHAMEARSQLRHRPTKEGTSFILLEHAKSVKRRARGDFPGRKNACIPPAHETHSVHNVVRQRLLCRPCPGSGGRCATPGDWLRIRKSAPA